MLTIEPLTLVPDLANVERVAQHVRERALAVSNAATVAAARVATLLAANAASIEVGDQFRNRAKGKIPLEDEPHRSRLGIVRDELAIEQIVAKRYRPAHPHALAL